MYLLWAASTSAWELRRRRSRRAPGLTGRALGPDALAALHLERRVELGEVVVTVRFGELPGAEPLRIPDQSIEATPLPRARAAVGGVRAVVYVIAVAGPPRRLRIELGAPALLAVGVREGEAVAAIPPRASADGLARFEFEAGPVDEVMVYARAPAESLALELEAAVAADEGWTVIASGSQAAGSGYFDAGVGLLPGERYDYRLIRRCARGDLPDLSICVIRTIYGIRYESSEPPRPPVVLGTINAETAGGPGFRLHWLPPLPGAAVDPGLWPPDLALAYPFARFGYALERRRVDTGGAFETVAVLDARTEPATASQPPIPVLRRFDDCLAGVEDGSLHQYRIVTIDLIGRRSTPTFGSIVRFEPQPLGPVDVPNPLPEVATLAFPELPGAMTRARIELPRPLQTGERLERIAGSKLTAMLFARDDGLIGVRFPDGTRTAYTLAAPGDRATSFSMLRAGRAAELDSRFLLDFVRRFWPRFSSLWEPVVEGPGEAAVIDEVANRPERWIYRISGDELALIPRVYRVPSRRAPAAPVIGRPDADGDTLLVRLEISDSPELAGVLVFASDERAGAGETPTIVRLRSRPDLHAHECLVLRRADGVELRPVYVDKSAATIEGGNARFETVLVPGFERRVRIWALAVSRDGVTSPLAGPRLGLTGAMPVELPRVANLGRVGGRS